jgi:hypothetical protein
MRCKDNIEYYSDEALWKHYKQQSHRNIKSKLRQWQKIGLQDLRQISSLLHTFLQFFAFDQSCSYHLSLVSSFPDFIVFDHIQIRHLSIIHSHSKHLLRANVLKNWNQTVWYQTNVYRSSLIWEESLLRR